MQFIPWYCTNIGHGQVTCILYVPIHSLVRTLQVRVNDTVPVLNSSSWAGALAFFFLALRFIDFVHLLYQFLHPATGSLAR